MKLKGQNGLEEDICVDMYAGHYKESYTYLEDIGEIDTAGLNCWEADTYAGPIKEGDTIMRDSVEPTIVGSRNGTRNGHGNGYNSEEIKELFNMEYLLDEDNEEFRAAKQKVNAYVRRKGNDLTQIT